MGTTIRLQTAARRDIPNVQNSEVPPQEKNEAADYPKRWKDSEFKPRLSPTYNCHGLTFASRRTRIWNPTSVAEIINDDKYVEVADRQQVRPGDVVVYYVEGEAAHSGIVLRNHEDDLHVPLIWSKWGNGPEVIHRVYDVHPLYGNNYVFYRCEL